MSRSSRPLAPVALTEIDLRRIPEFLEQLGNAVAVEALVRRDGEPVGWAHIPVTDGRCSSAEIRAALDRLTLPPPRTVVPPLWLQMLKGARRNQRPVHDLTIHQFYRELAKLGGFLGRRHDGEPGWITIWRGWEKLNTLVKGAQLAINSKKCG